MNISSGVTKAFKLLLMAKDVGSVLSEYIYIFFVVFVFLFVISIEVFLNELVSKLLVFLFPLESKSS